VLANSPQSLQSSLANWWRARSRESGRAVATSLLIRNLWSFARDSTPERRRGRYGDMDYDWEHRVNTTSGSVGWRARLLGLFHSPYQPTEPTLFHEMMTSLPIEFEQFTFIDLGSGKGRTLLMASEYPFRRIVGVELIAELHSAAEENIRAYDSATKRCSRIEAILGDARHYDFLPEPLLLYLFNPLPENALLDVLRRLQQSLVEIPRPVWIVYHNALLETTLGAAEFLEKIGGNEQYSVYRTSTTPPEKNPEH
jgi:SAM-dependent methyltransferase